MTEKDKEINELRREVARLRKALEEAEPKHGRWIDGFCSVCHEEAITEWNDTGGELYLSDYCPHCGAKMNEVEE